MNIRKLLSKIYLIVVFCLMIFSLVNISYAQENNTSYYADIVIDVKDNGIVDINGPTNYPKFQNVINSQDFTSKTGKIWELNINSIEKFETFIFEINMPEYTQINYIKTTPTFRISNEKNKIKIIGTGEDKPFTLIIQYEIEYSTGSFFDYNSKLLLFLSIMSLIFISISITYILTRKIVEKKKINKEIENIESKNTRNDGNEDSNITMMKSSKENPTQNIENIQTNNNHKENKPSYDYNILPQRQKDIIDILGERGKITQKELEKTMQIPKSSVSRNVRTLEIKGIVLKESVGQTNYLSLK